MKRLLTEASLIMKPEGQADGLLPSVKPIDGSGDFTFSRGSNLAATRVNQAGLIEKGRENLLLQSNQFDTTWSTSSQMNTPVGGQSGYDGSSDAWKIQRSDANARFIKQVISQSGVRTFSVYAKKGNVDYISLVSVGSQTTKAIFSLPTDGSGTNTYLDSDNIFADIVHIGNGWYRVSTTIDESITDVRIYPSETATAEGGVITDAFIYIQSAQLEIGLAATSHIETTTTTAKAGVLEDTPRLDYSGGATEPSLLLEHQRSNLIPQSEYFGASDWTKNNTSVAIGFASPDGTNNAYKMTDDSTDSKHGVYDLDVLPTDGNVYTRSVFVKKGTARYVVLSARHLPTSSGTSWIYDFYGNDWELTGSSGAGQSIENYGNGWIRLSISHISNSNFNNDFSIGISSGPNIADASYSGSGDTLYIWGAQIEAGSYPSSYIPTHGAAVSRSADSCSVTGVSDVIGQTEGTFFVEMGDDVNFGTVTTSIFCLDNNTANNRIELSITPTGNGRISFYVANGGTEQVNILSTSTLSANDKIAVAYKANDFALYLNGTAIDTDTSGSVPATSVARIAQRYDGGRTEKNAYKQTVLFDTRLTNAELATLTTL